MAIIIGAGTQVSFPGAACVVSANWNYNPNPQRLYCLGSWTPHDIIEKPTWTISLTTYAPGPTHSVPASDSCDDVQDQSISISPAGCGPGFPGSISGNFAISGYSYSKGDPNAPGQETWNFTRWPAAGGTPAPNYVIRGIVDGTATDPIVNTGIVFSGSTVEGSSGSVSAGSTGEANTTYHGVVSSIGGGTSAGGTTGNGSANIPLTPLWF